MADSEAYQCFAKMRGTISRRIFWGRMNETNPDFFHLCGSLGMRVEEIGMYTFLGDIRQSLDSYTNPFVDAGLRHRGLTQ